MEFFKDNHILDEEDYFRHHQDKYLQIKDIFEKLQPEKVLDIGVGTGAFYLVLKDVQKYQLHGVDFISDYLPILKQRGIKGQQCNIEKDSLPYEDSFFDLVICDSIIEHSLKPKHLISEMKRVLKKDGHFIVVFPNAVSAVRRWNQLRGRNIFEPLIDNLYARDYLLRCSVFYSIKEVASILKKNNLHADQIYYLNEKSHDSNTVSYKFLRLLSYFKPNFKDVVIVVGHK